MPELPEVEHLVRGVRERVVGARFKDMTFLRDDIREVIPKSDLVENLQDKTIDLVSRRGKYLIIQTESGALGVHLGMSGRFIERSNSSSLERHTHAIFEFEISSRTSASRIEFHFVDPRRFGRLFFLTPRQLCDGSHPFLSHLGVEPLDPSLDLVKHLRVNAAQSKTPIKNFIMNHEIIVGVGNIYASESLWKARVHPERKAHTLSLAEFRLLAKCIKNVLSEAIGQGGTTLKDYRDHGGNQGNFQQKLAVYGQTANPCVRCEHPVEKLVLSGRSTYFCPFCQK